MQLADSPQLLSPPVSAWFPAEAVTILPGSPWQWLSTTGLQGPDRFCCLRLSPSNPSLPLSFYRCQNSILVWRRPLLSSAGSLTFLLLPPNKPFALLTPSPCLLFTGDIATHHLMKSAFFSAQPILGVQLFDSGAWHASSPEDLV